MTCGNHITPGRQRGFSLIELLVAMGILTLVLGVVFNEIDKVQKRYRTEEAKLDIFQEARNFMDRFIRDLHSAGYPGVRMYQLGVITVVPPENDVRVATGLVSVTPTALIFESDVDGDGQVDSVRYDLLPNGGQCPCVLRRSQVIKLPGSPMGQPTSYFSMVDNVVNSAGSGGGGPNGSLIIAGNSQLGGGAVSNQTLYREYAGSQIFQAFDRNGNLVPLPVNIATPLGAAAVRSIRTIRVTLNVLATTPDPQTLQRPAVSLAASARLQN